MHSLAIVHHANQFLITDGYLNREGISDIVDAFDALLSLHLRYRIPLNLHLSGTLIESIAWHKPDFFDIVKTLSSRGLLELIGSAYAQNIMPFFSAEHNLRQVNETTCLYQRHFGVEPAQLKTFWVPERVWDSDQLVPLLENHALHNGGFRYVLLDDRLAFPIRDEHGTNQRRAFDGRAICADSYIPPFKISPGENLIALPISKPLRYNIPPRADEHWHALQQIVASGTGESRIYFYADDLEKAAGIGPWGSHPWQPGHLEPYANFLAWLSSGAPVKTVLISDWMQSHPVESSRPVDTGTYYELAETFGAGEAYTNWWNSPAWLPYRSELTAAQEKLLTAPSCARNPLYELAWKQLMASSYESGWHDVNGADVSPAPWACASASHVRTVFVLLCAAEWMSRPDGSLRIDRMDVDRDGDEEVVLRNDELCAVISPKCGGRIIYLMDFAHGTLIVGNPADDWNWQQAQNKFMEIPRNHTGAFADVGYEDDVYAIETSVKHDGIATLKLVNRSPASALCGATKTFSLAENSACLQVDYALPKSMQSLDIEFCLSPDYLNLLRGGIRSVCAGAVGTTRVVSSGASTVYVRPLTPSSFQWNDAQSRQCGHGFLYSLYCCEPRFTCEIGVRNTTQNT